MEVAGRERYARARLGVIVVHLMAGVDQLMIIAETAVKVLLVAVPLKLRARCIGMSCCTSKLAC
jgi:hypothetical protein